jgi:hypothetical protein
MNSKEEPHQLTLNQRRPEDFRSFLGSLQSGDFKEKGDFYCRNWPVLICVIEAAASITAERGNNVGSLAAFHQTEQGEYQISRRATVQDFEEIMEQKPFQGIKVMCVGGLEGRVLAHLGAEVVNVYPPLNQFPDLKVENLTEYSDHLDSEHPALEEEYDVIFSCHLMDSFSGLSFNGQNQLRHEELATVFLQKLWDRTKEGGINVHNGDLMEAAVKGLENADVKNILRCQGEAKNDSHAIWSVKKKEAIND